ncbi:hypothetical protein Scep_012549 [Stephania cephalantha]|uniref:Uncharacterized protein n=1 Tax=Stephania cephalantha TaxID=152367 RepID=A0AAP0JGP1_9MAGN
MAAKCSIWAATIWVARGACIGLRQRRQVVVGVDGDRCWSPPNRDGESATVEAGLVGGGGGRNSGELATVEAAKAGPVGRCGARRRCEAAMKAAVDAAAVRAVEGDNDDDGRS